MSGATHPLAGTAAAGARVGSVAWLACRLAGWILAGLAAGLILALLVPVALGARPFVVLSGSMEPTLRTGDVVVDERIAPPEARIGDIVTFRDPGRGGAQVTHRVRRMRAAGRKVVFVTKGDANNATERWRVNADGEIGRALYRIPYAGLVVIAVRTKTGLLFVVLLFVAVLGLWEIRDIWREGDGA